MKYLYEALDKPTRLYIKQCPHCGLKYFGKSTQDNIEHYQGSGIRWRQHLEKHGVEPVHLWNSDWYYDKSISRFALKFSRINQIVKSTKWANLVEENGINGGNVLLSKTDNEIKEITNKRTETNLKKYGVCNINQLPERKEYYKKLFTGREISKEAKLKMSKAKKGKGIGKDNNNYGNYWTNEQKQNLSKKRKESGIAAGKNNPMYGRKREDTSERNKLPKRWVTNGFEDKLILVEKLEEYLSIGYIIGRTNSRNKGCKINYSLIICERCSRHIRPTNYKRHLQKCLKRD